MSDTKQLNTETVLKRHIELRETEFYNEIFINASESINDGRDNDCKKEIFAEAHKIGEQVKTALYGEYNPYNDDCDEIINIAACDVANDIWGGWILTDEDVEDGELSGFIDLILAQGTDFFKESFDTLSKVVNSDIADENKKVIKDIAISELLNDLYRAPAEVHDKRPCYSSL